MEKIVLTLLTLVFPFILVSQSCLPEWIEFTTQSQIDSFQINYPGCTVIEGDVWIYDDDITNLQGLDVLTSIEGDLNIGATWSSGNTSLVSLSGLNNLISVGGDLNIINNESLESLIDLGNLSSIGRDLSIKINPSLTSLTGLEGLTFIGGDLWIWYNDVLSNCEVQSICDYLVSPNGSVNINHNETGCNNPPEIANACGFTLPCLPFGNYYFNQQDDIDDFQANYPGCNILNGEVGILGSHTDSYIKNLEGLNMVTTIAGNLRIIRSDSLINLQGLENLTSIGGNLIIGIAYARLVPGPFYCAGNPLLNNLAGLNNLDTVGGNVKIYCNYSLTDLSGLDNLSYIGGNLTIGDEESTYGNSLLTLTGLEALRTVDGSLEIIYNDLLSNLNGLNNLNFINEDLIIHGNNDLTVCEVESICNYLSAPNGEVYIGYNSPGCNSPEEVQDSCIANGISVEDHVLPARFTISPNPFTTSAILTYYLDKPANVTINIFNPQGQLIYLIEQEQTKGEQKIKWNAEGLPAGMYYFRIQAGDQYGSGKLILLR